MRTWLKYGLWFVGIYIVFITLILLTSNGGYAPLFFMPGFWLLELYKEIMGTGFSINAMLEVSINIIISIFTFFLIGAFIGKIKSRKQISIN